MNIGWVLNVTILWFQFLVHVAAGDLYSSSLSQDDVPKDPISVEIISVGNIYAASTLASLPYVAPGMSIALDEVQKSFGTSVSFKHTLLYDDQYKTCAIFTDNVDYLISKYYYSGRTGQYNMTVFIGAGCTERLNMGKPIRGWNSLMMIAGAGETVFRNKKLYPNVVLGGNNATKSHINSFTKFFAKYSWSSIYVLLDSSATPWHLLVVGNLVSNFNTKSFQMKYAKTDIRNPSARGELAVTLRDIRSSSRVIVFLGYPSEFRTFMLHAQAENLTNGDYVYIVNEPFHHRTYYGNLTWMYGNQDDQEAEQAFKSVFLITSAPETGTHLRGLETELKMRSQRDFNFTYAPDERPNLFATASYECVMMFGVVLQHLLHSFMDPNDGSAIGGLFWNRTFNLDTGSIQFDEVGERKQDMIVQHFQRKDVWPSAMLKLSGSADLFENVTAIEWSVPFPPPNEPLCGYSGMNSACLPSNGNYPQTTIIACAVFALAIMAVCAATMQIWFGGLSHYNNWNTFVIHHQSLHLSADSAQDSLACAQISSFAHSAIHSRKDL